MVHETNLARILRFVPAIHYYFKPRVSERFSVPAAINAALAEKYAFEGGAM
jgi:hypothetical protein